MVGLSGFEPPISCPPDKRSTKLSHSPTPAYLFPAPASAHTERRVDTQSTPVTAPCQGRACRRDLCLPKKPVYFQITMEERAMSMKQRRGAGRAGA